VAEGAFGAEVGALKAEGRAPSVDEGNHSVGQGAFGAEEGSLNSMGAHTARGFAGHVQKGGHVSLLHPSSAACCLLLALHSIRAGMRVQGGRQMQPLRATHIDDQWQGHGEVLCLLTY